MDSGGVMMVVQDGGVHVRGSQVVTVRVHGGCDGNGWSEVETRWMLEALWSHGSKEKETMEAVSVIAVAREKECGVNGGGG
ncbi:hypothetical protein L1987_13616 [Smallanthus sonchifolius]|uniref:Uncharacterized protein n=1 Tax=Smallanthus sonchifolius TaxID=185202 RepID=A0ACB9JI25_9ASTR|nr:hypothetical protein L1987_13616 [Smallanthus sonchifolius]